MKKKNPHAQYLNKLRNKKLSPERRREIALKAVAQRELNRKARELDKKVIPNSNII